MQVKQIWRKHAIGVAECFLLHHVRRPTGCVAVRDAKSAPMVELLTTRTFLSKSKLFL